MGGGDRATAFLALANREVQTADHLLSVTYPMTKDPKVLLSVAGHASAAIAHAAQAILANAGHSLQTDEENVAHVASFSLSGASEASKCYETLVATCKRYETTATAFPRGEKMIIAEHGFEKLHEVTLENLEDAMRTVKTFIHATNKHIMLGGGIHGEAI